MVEKLRDLCLHLNLISVRDLDCYSELELLYFMIKKLNEVIECVNGISEHDKDIIIEQLTAWLKDGTLAEIINEVAFSQLADKLDSIGMNAKYPHGGLEGCIGDGITDDTEHLQAMINHLHARGGGNIYFPKGTYLVGDVVLKSGVGLKGVGTLSTYMGTEHPVVLKAKSGVTTIINATDCTNSHINGIMFDGVDNNACGLIRGSFITVENCHFRKCKYALGNGIALQTFVIQNNKFDSNTVAIWSTVDSRIINNTINANNMGIKLGTGANDNIICENKIEWNTTIGIEMYQTNNCTISNNILDRQGNQGMDIKACNNCTINGNVFRRNSALGGDVPSNRTHIRSEANTNIGIVGNVFIKGAINDDGSGTEEPPYCVVDYSNTNELIIANQMTGCTNKSIDSYTSTNSVIANNVTVGM